MKALPVLSSQFQAAVLRLLCSVAHVIPHNPLDDEEDEVVFKNLLGRFDNMPRFKQWANKGISHSF